MGIIDLIGLFYQDQDSGSQD